MGRIHACWDESKGQKDLSLTEEAIENYNQRHKPFTQIF